jgi:hypothetical protein
MHAAGCVREIYTNTPASACARFVFCHSISTLQTLRSTVDMQHSLACVTKVGHIGRSFRPGHRQQCNAPMRCSFGDTHLPSYPLRCCAIVRPALCLGLASRRCSAAEARLFFSSFPVLDRRTRKYGHVHMVLACPSLLFGELLL